MKKAILVLMGLSGMASAEIPVWTFTPITATSVSVPENGTGEVQYTITNQSKKTHTLTMNIIKGVSQDMGGSHCKNPFTLGYKQSCTLKLNITGSQLSGNVTGGPVVCEQASQGLQCYQPSTLNQLNIGLAAPITTAIINVTGSPLTLTTGGAAGTLTVNNTSSELRATNVTAILTGTALDGNVTVNDSNCASIPALGSCTLTFTPLSTPVAATSFNIQGTNTNTVSASMTIQAGFTLNSVSPATGSASGGLGVTLTGTGLSGATGVTFDGVAATSVNVVNSTTVTAVTPAHAAGAVNIVITTPSGTATLNNGFTYVATAIGQPAYGGTIACLNGGLNNLIAATVDNSNSIGWGGQGTDIPGAQSTTDGAANTTAIVSTLVNNSGVQYAAKLCSEYEIDSQGNKPCQTGNTCYQDWFLPAHNFNVFGGQSDQLYCLYANRVAIGSFTPNSYWSSNNYSANNAEILNFGTGFDGYALKNDTKHVRCVRNFSL